MQKQICRDLRPFFRQQMCPFFTRIGGGGSPKRYNVTFFYRFLLLAGLSLSLLMHKWLKKIKLLLRQNTGTSSRALPQAQWAPAGKSGWTSKVYFTLEQIHHLQVGQQQLNFKLRDRITQRNLLINSFQPPPLPFPSLSLKISAQGASPALHLLT